MLSISRGMTAGNAGSYFSQEDYYLNGSNASQWLGLGAAALNLSGNVKESDFKTIASGCHPETGEQLVSAKITKDAGGCKIETHRAGNDLTFSAPKSLSVAYAAGIIKPKIAHDIAVQKVISHIEKYYSQFRSPEGIKTTNNLVAAKFDHVTSRSLDPQLHSHIFLLNAVKAPTGEWKANEPINIFRDQKTLGLLYRQELAYQLQLLGYQLEYTNREEMLFDIKGVDQELLKDFSQRRDQIERQVADWKACNKFPDATDSRLYEMATLNTRSAKDKNLTKNDIQKIWDNGFANAGTSREAIRASIENHRLKENNLSARGSLEIVGAAAAYLTETEAVIDRAVLLATAAKISGGQHSVAALSVAIDLHSATGIVKIGTEKGRQYYSTAEMRQLESRNISSARNLAGSFTSCTTRDEVETFLDRLQRDEGIVLSHGQRSHVINELTGNHGVTITQGDPGSGKTFSAETVERFVKEVLIPTGRGHFTINVAFTGKAALEMQEASGRQAFTIDSFLNSYHSGKVQIINSAHSAQSIDQVNTESQVKSGNLCIDSGQQVVIKIDEASFVGARQAEHLLKIVKDFQAQGIQAKILFVGDTKQMQAIASGDLFRQAQELAKAGKADFAFMTEINRQRDMGLRQIATTLNRLDHTLAENALDAIEALQHRNALIEVPEREFLIQTAADRYLTASSAPSNDPAKAQKGIKASSLLVTATNADRMELNRKIRELRVSNGEITEGKSYEILTSAQQSSVATGYHVGQRVIFSGHRGNDGKMHAWEARLMQEATITGINAANNSITVQYGFTQKDGTAKIVTKDLPAEQFAVNTSVYNPEARHFSSGDRIVFLKNDNTLGVKNGHLGLLENIYDNGLATVTLDDGKRVTFNFADYNNLDHAYAVTIHKSQGATVEQSILFSFIKPDQVQEHDQHAYGRASFNGLNVAITRAQYKAEILTNSIAGLKKAVQSIDIKTSTLHHTFREKPLPASNRFEQKTQAQLKKDSQSLTSKINGMFLKPVQAVVPESWDRLGEKIKSMAARFCKASGSGGKAQSHKEDKQKAKKPQKTELGFE